MDNVVKLPKRYFKTPPNGFKINLYTEAEIEMTLFCVNIWGEKNVKFKQEDLRCMPAQFVFDALDRGYKSGLLSYEAREIINKIMKSIEPIYSPSTKGGVSQG